MEHRLALIHTSPLLVPVFEALCVSRLPHAGRFHVVDESLIRNTIAAGRLEKTTIRRLCAQIGSCVEAGATAVLVTCSSIGPAVKIARELHETPIYRVDEAMAERAVAIGSRVGVLATLRTTIDPTVQLIRETAAQAGSDCRVIEELCQGAFEAVLAGDGVTHDKLVTEGLIRLAGSVDVVVLAQASMARVLERLAPDELPVPVLCSPDLAIEQIRNAIRVEAEDRLARVPA